MSRPRSATLPRPIVALRRRLAISATCLLAAGAAAGAASPASVLVVSGHGWGHGIGMSQWGARGYALHGWSYQKILAHYYPGTQLGHVAEPHVRVLLGEGLKVVTIGCASRMGVSDATGRGHPLAAGSYGVGPGLVLPVGRERVRVRHGRHSRVVVRTVGRRLQSPVVVKCDLNPLVVDGRPYHGRIVLRRNGGSLSVVNSLPLDTYLRGVVGAEMPSRWSPAALEAQAVAARSYAVATLHPSEPFDLFPDDRSQVYVGIAAETPATDLAVAETKGQVLTWDGRVATTYYSSSSGGRTADIRDLHPGSAPVPYLRPVADPYDVDSPNHAWGPIVFTPEQLAARLGIGGAVSSVAVERSPSGRAAALDVRLASGGGARLAAKRVEEALHLRSTWFSVRELGLSASSPQVLYGRRVRLAVGVSGTGPATLQRRLGGGPWLTVRRVSRGTTLRLRPQGTTAYRLSVPGVQGPELAVAVAPRVTVTPLAPTLLAGRILPRPSGAVTVWRYVGGGWRLVARPRVDALGVFRTPVRLRPGGYRVSVAGDGRLAAAEAHLDVSKRLLASLRRG
jgi:stage II sporulation protein D